MIPPYLTLSNIRYVSRVKWSNPGKEVAPSLTPRCSNYWKGSLLVTLNYGRQLYFFTFKHVVWVSLPNKEIVSHQPNQTSIRDKQRHGQLTISCESYGCQTWLIKWNAVSSGGVETAIWMRYIDANLFESHWVPLSYGLVPHLSKKLCKFP